MNILVINAHWYNRGDEAAIRSMIIELRKVYPGANMRIQFALAQMKSTESVIEDAEVIDCFPRNREILNAMAFILSSGKICIGNGLKKYIENVAWADVILHAPGGPSLSDIYIKDEPKYLCRLAIAKVLKKPYIFYAPSMGPFNRVYMNPFRKYVLKSAKEIILREAISRKYVEKLKLKRPLHVTLDSAFQADIDSDTYEKVFQDDIELSRFFNTNKRVVGITITPLSGNPAYSDDVNLHNKILECFQKFVIKLEEDGYGVIFIPQLFGKSNDYDYMKKCAAVGKNTYVMKPSYDCFFQQFIIGKLYMVFGMRYHSNIFSAKMGTPFVSISYEQKMRGFMQIAELEDACLDVRELSFENLMEKYKLLTTNYGSYKERLLSQKKRLADLSYQTTRIVVNTLSDIR